jgi:probable phosphomutase (TIGR03848 family)
LGTVPPVPTVVLVRHGRSAANAKAVLAGRTPGVHLDETGQAQAQALADRLRTVPLAAVVTSPLERCTETAAPIVAAVGREAVADERLVECDYGDWTGRELKDLAKLPEWKAVQAHPSAVQFPAGESMRGMQARAVNAVRDWDARLAAEHGDSAVWVAVSHADVIKAVLADALGMHLDEFQRIVVDPGSASIIRYTALRPFVTRVNDTGGSFVDLLVPKRRRRSRTRSGRQEASDAVVGGTTGTTT